jgi:CRISP-associated protein Cas1
MIKRTLFFANPCRLTLKNKQLVSAMQGDTRIKTVPVEDIGTVLLENQQISISLPLLNALVKNNTAVVLCDETFHPSAMFLNLNGHHLQQELFSSQIKASEPLKKQLWKQTIVSKICNQALLLQKIHNPSAQIERYATKVKSGDSDNREAAAAQLYWPMLFGKGFMRDRYGMPPNNMLNYGYAILRAAVARALAGSGLLATFGIHHHNRYNAFCLADDIMEPYRPFVDGLVYQLDNKFKRLTELTTEVKMELLSLLTSDIVINGYKRPLMVGLSQTTASLARCFAGDSNKIEYPEIIIDE